MKVRLLLKERWGYYATSVRELVWHIDKVCFIAI